ncbi:hypothetical protein BDM02DRAFT_3227836, partial [Thelephora ganbajun]
YNGPYIVVHYMKGGLYIISEVDGSVSSSCITAFCLVSYDTHTSFSLPVLTLTGFNLGGLNED